MELERNHDYIQWLFPLTERSQYNKDAPILSKEDIEVFNSDPLLRDNLKESFLTMLEFYGFMVDLGKVGYSTRTSCYWDCWLTHNNHNYLRITRILKSMTLLGLGDYAKSFLRCLEEVYSANPEVIGQKLCIFGGGGNVGH